MKLQALLRNGSTPDDLLAHYAIKWQRHPRFANLIQFKYDMLESPMGEQVVQEARGVILDEADNWAVISRPFDKFFNYGEGHAPAVDWATARVQEKVDGSLMVLYHYAGSWHVASSGTPDAGGEVNGFGFPFRDLFWETWRKMDLQLPKDLEELAFMFELTSPLNRVVVAHDKASLTLIGVRRRDGQEFPAEMFSGKFTGRLEAAYGSRPPDTWPVYPVVKSYPLGSFDEIEATFKAMSPTAQEGYVVVDDQWNRIKVKNPAYVALHHLRDTFSMRRMLEVVVKNETSEFLTYFPEWKNTHAQMTQRYEQLITDLNWSFGAAMAERLLAGRREVNPTPALLRKAFAAEAVKSRCPSVLFQMLDGPEKSIREIIATLHIDYLANILRIDEISPPGIAQAV